MWMLLSVSAIVYGSNGESAYIQSMGRDGYNVWSNEGLTTVRDYGGWEQIRYPNGETTTVIDQGAGEVPVIPVLPLEVLDGD